MKGGENKRCVSWKSPFAKGRKENMERKEGTRKMLREAVMDEM